MCGGPDLPAAPDPAEERKKADAEATQAANARTAELRRARRGSSLLAAGSAGGNAGSALAYGKDKLGS